MSEWAKHSVRKKFCGSVKSECEECDRGKMMVLDFLSQMLTPFLFSEQVWATVTHTTDLHLLTFPLQKSHSDCFRWKILSLLSISWSCEACGTIGATSVCLFVFHGSRQVSTGGSVEWFFISTGGASQVEGHAVFTRSFSHSFLFLAVSPFFSINPVILYCYPFNYWLGT